MKKIALLFPGQGSQAVAMGKKLCSNYGIAQEVFDEASEVLGFDLKRMCFEGDLEELTKTVNTQPALLTFGFAAYKVFEQEFGIIPTTGAGHSLGEITALTCSGVLDFKDAVKIVRQRGKFMQEAVAVGEGAMSAVSGVSKEEIERICRQFSKDGAIVAVSNYNSPEQIVISGNAQAVKQAGTELESLNARVVPLKVSAPFHSQLMQPAADRFREELQKYSYKSFNWPIISNVTARTYESEQQIIDMLAQQIVKPVLWTDSMSYLRSLNIDLAVELGPQSVLKNLMRKNAPGINVYSIDKDEDIKELSKIFKEAEVLELKKDNQNKFDFIIKCMAATVCTKNNNWDNEEFQKGVVEPYRRIQSMLEKLEMEGKGPADEQLKDAIYMIKSVFETKKVPFEEQKERYSEIFQATGADKFLKDVDLSFTGIKL